MCIHRDEKSSKNLQVNPQFRVFMGEISCFTPNSRISGVIPHLLGGILTVRMLE